MKTKTWLTLAIGWFCISAIIAFAATTSLALNSQTEEKYNNLIDTAEESCGANFELYKKSLESGFAALTEIVNTLPAHERQAFLASYGENRPDVDYIRMNDVQLYSNENNEKKIDLENTAPALDFPSDGKIYGLAFKETPTKQFSLCIKGSVGGNTPDEAVDTIIVVFSKDGTDGIADSAELYADGRIVLVSPANRIITEAKERTGDSLTGLITLSVVLCVLGTAMSVFIVTRFTRIKAETTEPAETVEINHNQQEKEHEREHEEEQ